MKLIQSYCDYTVTNDSIESSGGYSSAITNWLSMAYSCLLLKKYNPGLQLVFYGNDALVRLFKDLFKLPYDDYEVIESSGEYAGWFYCWPKIAVYNRQTEPFIHIDTDVFMWQPVPDKLLHAPLVAQHLEKDSTFYMRIWNQIKSDDVNLPEYVKSCNDGKYVHACNAGMIGGNDVAFIKDYTKEIRKFLDGNKIRLRQSDKKYLYNVVFEQWLYYGLSKSKGREPVTFYDGVVTDFDMGKEKPPCQTVSTGRLGYMHVMEYKGNIRCNRFIVYRMLSEFPREYERILSVCGDYGIRSTVYSTYTDVNVRESDSYKRSAKLAGKGKVSEIRMAELDRFETMSADFLLQCQNNRSDMVKVQLHDLSYLGHNTGVEEVCETGEAVLSPRVKIVDADSVLVETLVPEPGKTPMENSVVLLVYNAVFNRVDEFIWTRRRLDLLLSLTDDGTDAFRFLISKSEDGKISGISDFLRQCLFDGIITIRQSNHNKL